MSKSYRGPESGYCSDAKQEYRESVWGSFTDFALARVKDTEDAYAVMLPSKSGEEIAVAISRGVPEDKIICVDENPALIASSAWRKKYPSCKYYGCKVSQLAAKMHRDKRRAIIANLDLCNNFSEELITEVNSFMCDVPKYEGFNLAVTLSKGREGKAVVALLGMIASSYKMQEKRFAALLRSFGFGAPPLILLNEGSYIHNRTPMAWAVFSAIPKTEIAEKCSREIRILGRWKTVNRLLTESEDRVRSEMFNVRAKRHRSKTPWKADQKAISLWESWLERKSKITQKFKEAEWSIADAVTEYSPISDAHKVSTYSWREFLPDVDALTVECGPSGYASGIKI